MSDQTTSVLTPSSDEDAASLVARAAGKKRSLDIVGGNTREGIGRPRSAKERISSAGLRGITLYEPAELVISARSGTPISEVEATLAERGQMLAFEPMDHRSLYGTIGEPTIGGVAATNASGPRRIKAGAARDALLGLRFINGRGEQIKAGGRVMKNVTGLDIGKAICGSHGTLAFITEVTFKVLPRPEVTATLAFRGLDDKAGLALLSEAFGSPFEPSAAAHLPAGIGADIARTLVRLEGFSDSVAHRISALGERLATYGGPAILDGDASREIWSDIRDASVFAEPSGHAVWRISTIANRSAELVSSIRDQIPDAKWFFDWGGGLVWVSVPPTDDAKASSIRAAVAAVGGHATLIRADDDIRQKADVFQPVSPVEARLAEGLKRSFDPDGVFGPGRMYAEHPTA